MNLAGELPTTTSGGIAAARSYEYDRTSNPTTITDARWGDRHYHYNASEQITRVKHEHNQPGLAGERFSYDCTHNITQSEQLERGTSLSLLKEPLTQASHNDYRRAPGGRIERRGDTTYAYDAQGRLISKRTERKGFRPQKWQYQWDGEDQLRRVTTPDDAVWDYRYDPFGRRIGKACIQTGNKRLRQAQKVSYLWAGNLLSEERRIYADGSEQTVAYHYEQDSFRPIAQEVDGELSYIVTDHLGTPKELLSEEGELIWSVNHKLWGGIAQTQAGSRSRQAANDADGNATCLLRFQGQLEDEESGLYYNRFRYYDPQSGGYVSSDPIGLAGGLTLHGYVSNPGGWVDPFGLACKKEKLDRHHSTSGEYDKHTKVKSKEDAQKLSSGKKGEAQYWSEDMNKYKTPTAHRNALEKEALRNGKLVKQVGGSDYYLYDAGRVIGYNGGIPVTHMRVDVTKTSVPVFHGHPITKQKYDGYVKKAE